MNDTKYADKQIYRVVINAPIETVWSELVNTTSPRPFFYNSSWDTPGMKPGSPYRMLSKNQKVVAVVGEILAMDPPHRLETTFHLTTVEDAPCRVIYELEETPEGTAFSLITENVPAGSKSEKSMAEGSVFIVENFKAYVETGKLTFGARMMLAMMDMMPFSPPAMRAEKWPLETNTQD